MKRASTLFLLLFAFWLLLSGHYDLWFMGLGFISSASAVFLARRMGIVDAEGLPLDLVPGLLRYAPWLFGTVMQANFDVARRILHPRLPITPRLIHVPAEQRTAPGQASYANSITLTPGTISLEVGDEEIEVHALSVDAAEDLQSGQMGRRVAALETH